MEYLRRVFLDQRKALEIILFGDGTTGLVHYNIVYYYKLYTNSYGYYKQRYNYDHIILLLLYETLKPLEFSCVCLKEVLRTHANYNIILYILQ